MFVPPSRLQEVSQGLTQLLKEPRIWAGHAERLQRFQKRLIPPELYAFKTAAHAAQEVLLSGDAKSIRITTLVDPCKLQRNGQWGQIFWHAVIIVQD